jgi:hypothetical protein
MRIGQFSLHQNDIRKAILAGAAFAVLAAPIAIGFPPPALAQTMMQATMDTPEKIAERRAEQATPRKTVTFDPPLFDKYTGFYELTPTAVFTIRRDGSHFLTRLTGQQDVEIFPESDSKFFATVVAAQISFDTDASGKVTDLVLHQAGMERAAPRIDEATATQLEAALLDRIKNHTASPGTEAALRFSLQSLEAGTPDLSNMTPTLAAITKPQLPNMLATIQSLGALQSITFMTVAPGGADIYDVKFARGAMEWRVMPLNRDGKIEGMGGRPLP